MDKPSDTAYHLGYIVTAHSVFSCALILGITLFAQSELGLHPLAPLAGVITIIVPILAAEPSRRREKPTCFGPANRITLFRSLLIACIAILIGAEPSEAMASVATYLAIIALSLDGVDGLVARKTNTISNYGAQFDMEVDAFFTLVLSVLVLMWGHAGIWVLFCGLARYMWLGVQILVPWFNRPLPPEPAFRRKTACVLGVGGLGLALYPWTSSLLNTGLASIATISLFISFAIDTRWLIQKRTEPLSC